MSSNHSYFSSPLVTYVAWMEFDSDGKTHIEVLGVGPQDSLRKICLDDARKRGVKTTIRWHKTGETVDDRITWEINDSDRYHIVSADRYA